MLTVMQKDAAFLHGIHTVRLPAKGRTEKLANQCLADVGFTEENQVKETDTSQMIVGLFEFDKECALTITTHTQDQLEEVSQFVQQSHDHIDAKDKMNNHEDEHEEDEEVDEDDEPENFAISVVRKGDSLFYCRVGCENMKVRNLLVQKTMAQFKSCGIRVVAHHSHTYVCFDMIPFKTVKLQLMDELTLPNPFDGTNFEVLLWVDQQGRFGNTGFRVRFLDLSRNFLKKGISNVYQLASCTDSEHEAVNKFLPRVLVEIIENLDTHNAGGKIFTYSFRYIVGDHSFLCWALGIPGADSEFRATWTRGLASTFPISAFQEVSSSHIRMTVQDFLDAYDDYYTLMMMLQELPISTIVRETFQRSVKVSDNSINVFF